jgi:DNA-binding transcriptional ArsR family regulator
MGERLAKDALFDALTAVTRALSSGRRAEIVELLAQGERSVESVARAIDQSTANTSNHLRALARAGLVATRRDGTQIFYRLASDRVAALWGAIRDVAAVHVLGLEALAAAYLGDRASLEEVGREELLRRLRAGDVLVLDVRPQEEFVAGHIAEAVSLPIDALEEHLNEIPADVDVVAYCRGPYCVYADEAVRLLEAHGRRAARLEDGYPEWRRAGLPVAVGGR